MKSSNHMFLTPGLLCLALLLLVPTLARADHRAPYVIGNERYGVLGPSYFVGTNPNGPNGNEQVKFHTSVRYRMVEFERLHLGIPERMQLQLYFAFTQTSFWNLYDESAPFFDNNFQPESFLYFTEKSWPLSLSIGVRHQSNGRSDPVSRGWNRAYGAVHFGSPETNAIFGSATWWGFGDWSVWGHDRTNADILDYFGRGNLELYIAPGQLLRKGTLFPFRVCGFLLRIPIGGQQFIPGIEASLFLGLPQEEYFSPSLMVQYVDGFGQRLIDYDRDQTSWRFGLALIR